MAAVASIRCAKAAEKFRAGRARHPYVLRKEIIQGTAAGGIGEENTTCICVGCRTLVDLKDVFEGFVHTGRALSRRRAIYTKPTGTGYYDLTKQNEFLVKSVFDGKGNYLYHRDCIRSAFGVSNQRLARLRKGIQIETQDSTELVQKQEICTARRFSDIVLPQNCEQPAQKWLESQPDDASVQCKKRPNRHRNAKHPSNHTRGVDTMNRFLTFVDNNSASNGRKEGSSGKTFYFDRKFTQIRTPDKKDPQYEYKCRRSVLFEFNRTMVEDGLKPISVGTFHNWLKEHRPYVGICPSMSDYCDRCKEFEEEASRCQQIINRLVQSGHATEEQIMEQKAKLLKVREDHNKHKDDAQDALSYYRTQCVQSQAKYAQITSLLSRSRRTRNEDATLSQLQCEYSAFVSADYMMSKNLPFWGESPQPAKTYYQMKLVCDVFGIVDHSQQKNYTYLCDELAAGSKNSDHTISFFQHLIDNHIDSWVRNITFCLDNARVCKNKYLLAWANELVEKGRFESVRFFYLVVGHTKFEPDRLFASIAKTFYKRDVFCIEMLQAIAEQYSTSYLFSSDQIMQWRSLLEEKYLSLPGITKLHDFVVSIISGSTTLRCKTNCYDGSLLVNPIQKPECDVDCCNPSSYALASSTLSKEKLAQLTEQHDRFIKADIDGYVRPSFLHSVPTAPQDIASNSGASTTASSASGKTKRACSLCDGKGHVLPGKKRHYSEKYCSVAAKQAKT